VFSSLARRRRRLIIFYGFHAISRENGQKRHSFMEQAAAAEEGTIPALLHKRRPRHGQFCVLSQPLMANSAPRTFDQRYEKTICEQQLLPAQGRHQKLYKELEEFSIQFLRGRCKFGFNLKKVFKVKIKI